MEITSEDIKISEELKKEYDSKQIKLSENEKIFIEGKLKSKLWRMDNLYHINDKEGRLKVLKLNTAQRKILTEFRHNKKIILKSRQQGISTMYLAYNVDSCLFKSGYSAGIQSYGLDESNKLQMRAELMWDKFDQDIKDLLGLKLVMNNQKGMMWNNGSILKIGNFRGDTLQSLHVSELGKIDNKSPDKSRELKTGAFQAVGKNNIITIESTAEGRHGLFYETWRRAELLKKTGAELGPFDFQAIFLSWVIDNDCNIDMPKDISDDLARYFDKIEKDLGIKLLDTQKWWYAAKKEELGDDMGREYPTTAEEAFQQSVEGTYYANEYKNLVIEDKLYDENLLVFRAVDLGMNDTFSIGFFQIRPEGQPIIIGEYENNGHGLDFYADICEAISKKFGWKMGATFVPHDSNVRELIADKTRFDRMKELGFEPILIPKHKLQDGIEATRQFLKTCKVDSNCERVLLAIQNYRRKFDPNFSVYLDKPVHDEFSHTADMLRYMAMGCKYYKPSKIYVNNYYNELDNYRENYTNPSGFAI